MEKNVVWGECSMRYDLFADGRYCGWIDAATMSAAIVLARQRHPVGHLEIVASGPYRPVE